MILLCVIAGKVPPPETAQLYFCTLARRGYPQFRQLAIHLYATLGVVPYTLRGTLS
jgi:hypothetical protein